MPFFFLGFETHRIVDSPAKLNVEFEAINKSE